MMDKIAFKDLEVGQRFRYNLMFWRKTERKQEGTKMVNAKFLSDDHYEQGKTGIFIGGANVLFGGGKLVEPVNEKTRREKVLEEMQTA